jgi:hypothetical protein
VTGVSFGTLETEYKGAAYWDNFAEYIYGGYIEDSTGHREPLVFLQNIFSHRMHEDFDIAISPSRFARLKSLKTPDTYKVYVYAYGVADIAFEVSMKDYINGGVTIDTATYTTAENGADKDIYISGVDNFSAYDPASLKLIKGGVAVDASKYEAVKDGDRLKLTLKTALFTGAFQGVYTVSILTDTAEVASKTLAFTLIKSIERPQLTTSSDLSGAKVDAATSGAAIAVTKADKVYFDNDEFATALITAGRSGFTSIKEADGTAVAAAIGAGAARSGEGQPYYLDLSAAVFEAGKLYEITANATGFAQQKYYIRVTN